ncbi:MAG: DNA repair protein RadA [Chloroflexi bacterium]|jgi:DNA repair protein RadA/Sms|nr:DNA repair protein RadA [Chloroflexota bacterium]
MARVRSRYVCQSCGATQPGWMGRCPECGEWNTLVETVVEAPTAGAPATAQVLIRNKPLPLSEIATQRDEHLPVPMEELSRVLGGGIVPGSVTLLSGDPGIGKSTLLLQLAAMLCVDDTRVLYVSGEESVQQVHMRARRLGIRSPQLYLSAETSLEQILAQIEDLKPVVAVVDSVQAIHMEGLASSSGSVSQVRECAVALAHLAKTLNVAVFLIGHVTKAGSIAGPRVLEHVVDTVLYMEGERFHSYRLLRSVKNRFGSTDEVGVFEMREDGLVQVPNPSEVFLAERLEHATGSAIAITMEGTRPILVEVQALVSPSNLAYPRRTGNGVEANRLQLLAAVLTKRAGLRLNDQDVFVNVVGGLRVHEPAIDLAVAAAIASGYYGRPLHDDLAVFGEVGLAGELRSVGHIERRLRESAKLGFGRVLMPRIKDDRALPRGEARTVMARTLVEAIDVALQS